MTVQSTIEPSIPREPFDKAIREVNEFRGRCLHYFADAEAAVSGCLARLSQVPGRGDGVKLRHLVGQRCEDLASALSTDASLKKDGNKALEALNDFRELDWLRVVLCHGVSTVLLDANGDWTAVFHHSSFRSRELVPNGRVIARRKADELQKELSRKSRRLRSLVNALS